MAKNPPQYILLYYILYNPIFSKLIKTNLVFCTLLLRQRKLCEVCWHLGYSDCGMQSTKLSIEAQSVTWTDCWMRMTRNQQNLLIIFGIFMKKMFFLQIKVMEMGKTPFPPLSCSSKLSNLIFIWMFFNLWWILIQSNCIYIWGENSS